MVTICIRSSRPAVADKDPRLFPLSAQADFDLSSIHVVINTHLHFDPCGGNMAVFSAELDESKKQPGSQSRPLRAGL